MKNNSLERCAQRPRIGLSVSLKLCLQPEHTLVRIINLITGSVVPNTDGQPRKRGRPNKRKEKLRLNALIYPEWQKYADSYHKPVEKIIQSILDANPELKSEGWELEHLTGGEPNPPWKAAHSQYRTWDGNMTKAEREWRASLESRWNGLLASLSAAARSTLIFLIELWKRQHARYGADEGENIAAWHDWLASAEKLLPPEAFGQLMILATEPRFRELLAGWQLQQERIAYHLPGQNSNVHKN
jgi:hypothetical protein